MAGIRKRKWTTKDGKINTCYEITYYINNKQYRKSGYKTKLDAQKDLEEVTKTFKSGITLKKLFNEYVERHCELMCKQSTIEMYKSNFEVIKPLHDIIADNLNQKIFKTELLRLKQNGYKDSTLNLITGIIKLCLNFGIENEYISKNPLQKLKKIKTYKKDVAYIQEEDIPVFLDILKKHPQAEPIFYTALNTGMRESELFGISWYDIYFKTNQINIDKQLYKGKLQKPKTKSSIRVIDIPQSLSEYLYKLKCSTKTLYQSVFVTTGDKTLKSSNVSFYMKKIREELADATNNPEYNKLRFHDLRHTYASLLLSNGASISYVQHQLGHSTSTMTLNIYNHCMRDTKKNAMNILEKTQNLNKYEQNVSIKR